MIDRVINGGVVNGLYVKMCINYIYIYITHYHLPLPKQGRPSSETVSWSPNGLKMDRQKGQPNERQKTTYFSLSPLSKFHEKPEPSIKTNRSWFYCINHHVVSQIPIENIWNLMLEAPMPGETMISPSPLGVQTHTPHPPSQSSSPNRVASLPREGPTNITV